MKKHLIITGIICIATIPPATAVTKCVNLSSSTTCSDASGSGSQWTATCNEIPVSGVAFCSNKKGTSSGAKSSTLTASTTSNANKYCWIKMTSPATGHFLYRAQAMYFFISSPRVSGSAVMVMVNFMPSLSANVPTMGLMTATASVITEVTVDQNVWYSVSLMPSSAHSA